MSVPRATDADEIDSKPQWRTPVLLVTFSALALALVAVIDLVINSTVYEVPPLWEYDRWVVLSLESWELGEVTAAAVLDQGEGPRSYTSPDYRVFSRHPVLVFRESQREIESVLGCWIGRQVVTSVYYIEEWETSMDLEPRNIDSFRVGISVDRVPIDISYPLTDGQREMIDRAELSAGIGRREFVYYDGGLARVVVRGFGLLTLLPLIGGICALAVSVARLLRSRSAPAKAGDE